MFDPAHVPPVAADELLARFILSSGWVRRDDSTVKPDAFIPHPHAELSMTRHAEAAESEIWAEGERIANFRGRTLYGRADVNVAAFTGESLSVRAAPIPENPNHANAEGWPSDKPLQKIKALEIAQRARYVPRST